MNMSKMSLPIITEEKCKMNKMNCKMNRKKKKKNRHTLYAGAFEKTQNTS